MSLRANIVSKSDTPLGILISISKDEAFRASVGCHAEKSFDVFNAPFRVAHVYFCQDAQWWMPL